MVLLEVIVVVHPEMPVPRIAERTLDSLGEVNLMPELVQAPEDMTAVKSFTRPCGDT
jgi:hypothetical protein